MRVSYAVQILSHSVAAGLFTYVRKGHLPLSAKQTATFVERVNDLFDVGNSSSTSCIGYKSPISNENFHQLSTKILEDTQWIQQWRFEDQRSEKLLVRDSLPFKKGLLVTLKSICSLSQHLIQKRLFKYVCTRRFTQDCVENVFSVIRRNRGGFNDHPEAQSALQSLRMLSCVRVLDPCVSNISNCEITGEEMLIHLGNHCFLLNPVI